MKLFSVEKVNDIVHIDIVGPLISTSYGNKCILIMVDRFSRYVMAIPMPNMKTITVVRHYMR